jgi:hypothetical protein
MVHHYQEKVFLLGRLPQKHPEKRPAAKIKRFCYLLIHLADGFSFWVGFGTKINGRKP